MIDALPADRTDQPFSKGAPAEWSRQFEALGLNPS
jgi:hypothetical protein